MTAVARAVVNPHLRVDRVAAPPGDEVLWYHQGLPGYHPTPLRDIAAPGVGTTRLKDESDRFGLPAFKILGASWAVERVLASRGGTSVLVAASAGNHGRAVARTAARRGIACRIFLPATATDARAGAIRAEGADVVAVDGDYDAAVAAAEREATAPRTALIADTGTAPTASWVIEGYVTLFREAAAQTPDPFDLIMVPVGVGAFAAAAVRFAVHHRPPAAVVGVEPHTAACVTASLVAGRPVTIPTLGTTMTGLDCATPSASAWPTLRDGLTGTLTVSDDEVHETMRSLAARGVVAGDCGAAPLAGLRALSDDPRARVLRDAVGLGGPTRALCVSTEGATDPAAYGRIVRPPRRRAPDGPTR